MRRRLPPFAAVRAFEAAARHGSMQAASEELSLTPSAISHQVKSLEAFVGAALFERVPGRLRLTETGAAYVADLGEILDGLEAATCRASGLGQNNHVTVAMYHSLAEHWFVPLLLDFHACHPDMRISVVSDESAADFASGIADASIVYETVPPGAEDTFLVIDVMAPCCSRTFLETHGPIASAEDLLRHPLIWCDADAEEWPRWLAHAGVPDRTPQRWIAFDLRAGTLAAARRGLGIAMGRRPYIEDLVAGGDLVLPLGKGLQTGCGYRLVTPARTKHLPKVKRFSAWLKAASREAAERVPIAVD